MTFSPIWTTDPQNSHYAWYRKWGRTKRWSGVIGRLTKCSSPTCTTKRLIVRPCMIFRPKVPPAGSSSRPSNLSLSWCSTWDCWRQHQWGGGYLHGSRFADRRSLDTNITFVRRSVSRGCPNSKCRSCRSVWRCWVWYTVCPDALSAESRVS